MNHARRLSYLLLAVALGGAAGSGTGEGQAAASPLSSINMSSRGLDAIEEPPAQLSAGARSELESAWRRISEPLLRAFLRSAGDRVSYRVGTGEVNGTRYLHFLARGQKAEEGPDAEPRLVLEIFYQGGQAAVDRAYPLWFEPFFLGKQEIRRIDFYGDRAAYSRNMMNEGTQSVYWQAGDHLVRVHRETEVRALAEKVHRKALQSGFYDFPRAILGPEASDQDQVSKKKRPGDKEAWRLGIQAQEVTPVLAELFELSKPQGALVGKVHPGSPAEKNGFRKGDVIVLYNDEPIPDPATLQKHVAATPVNRDVEVAVIRKGRRKVLKVFRPGPAEPEKPGAGKGKKEIPPPAPATLKNAASARDDAKVLTWTSQYNDKEWAARNINDQSLERNWFWSSRKRPEFPQDIVLRLAEDRPWKLSRVEINPATTNSSDRWAKRVSILTGDSYKGPWEPAGTFLLKEENRFQSFDLPPRTTRHVMVRVESNRGGVYAQLGEIRIWAEPREKSEAKKPEPVKKKKSVDTSPPTANPPPAEIPKKTGRAEPPPLLNQVDFPGGTFMSRSVSKAGDCRRLCEGHSGCRAFTWVRREFTGDRRPVCRLKNRIPSKRSHPCCVSGIVRPVN